MEKINDIKSYFIKTAADSGPTHEHGWVNFSGEAKVWRRLLQANRASCDSLYLIYSIDAGCFPDHIHPGIEWAYMLSGQMKLSDPECTVGPHDFVWVKSGSKHVDTTVTAGTCILVYNQSGINWLNEKGQQHLYTTDDMIKKYYAYFNEHGMDQSILDSVILV